MAARSVDDFIVDFSEEQEGGGAGQKFKKGWYKVRIIKGTTGLSEDKGTPYLELTFKFKDGTYAKAKKTIEDRLYITPKAMRRFRLLLESLDMRVPSKLNVAKLIPKLKNQELWIYIDDEPPREGYSQTRSRVSFDGFLNIDEEPAGEDEDEEDEDEEDEEEEDEDEEEEDEEDEDEDEDEEDEEDEDEDEDEEPPKRRRSAKATSKAKATPKRKRAEPEEDEDEEDEDEDEEPPKRRRSTKAKATPKKKTSRSKKRASDDDDEDLDDLDLEKM